jgi:hypothetical protein
LKREFISTSIFQKQWKQFSLTDDDLRKLERHIMEHLFEADIIVGSGGAVKVRFALPGKGKSGGIRIIYTDVTQKEKVYLLLCYAKNEQDDLTDEQKQQLKPLIKTLKGE